MLQDMLLNPHLLTVPSNIGGRPTEELQEELGLSEIVRLGANENPFGPSLKALAAFQGALQDAHRYPGIADRRLRQKLAAHYNASHAASFTDSNFLTGNGLSDVLRMIAHAFLFGGGEALYCNPTFPLYGIYARMFGATATPVPHDCYRYNLRALREAISPNTRVIFLCNPNNPTGTVVSSGEVEAFMQRVPPSVLVVFDESYYDFVDDPGYTRSVEYVRAGMDNVVVLRSFSKIYGMANLRIGYALATTNLIGYLARAQIVFNTSDAVLRAAAAALDDQEYVQTVRQWIAGERAFLSRGLAELGQEFVPSQANFILLVNLPRDARAIEGEILKRGIIVRAMGGFGMPEAIRVTIGTRAENERLLGVLQEMQQERVIGAT